jgi:hypothetical protein
LSIITDVPSETLAQQTNGMPFRAEILAVLVEESTNLLAEYGLRETTSVVTNHYLVRFRDANGKHRILRGLNVSRGELERVSQLRKGDNCTFPEALLE